MSEEKKYTYVPDAKTTPGTPNTVFIDINKFSEKQNDITNAESRQILDQEAMQALADVNGTSCIQTLINNWHNVADTGDGFRDFGINVVDQALTKEQKSFVDIDNVNAKAVEYTQVLDNNNPNKPLSPFTRRLNIEATLLKAGYTEEEIESMGFLKAYFVASGVTINNLVKPSPFDDYGLYGPSQSLPVDHVFKLSPDCPINLDTLQGQDMLQKNPEYFDKYISIVGQEDYDAIKKLPQAKNMTKAQLFRELYFMKMHGCTYMTPVSIILQAYKDKPVEFEALFGFPLRDEYGDYNFILLQTYYFLEEGGMVHLNMPEGIKSYSDAKADYYVDHPEEFKQKYGSDFYYDKQNKVIDSVSIDKLQAEAELLRKQGQYDFKFYDHGGNDFKDKNRFIHFIKKHNVLDVEFWDPNVDLPFEGLTSLLDDGYSVSISVSNGLFEDENGNKVIDYKGGHEVFVTDYTDDGRLIISSWGRKFYLDPKKHAGDGRLFENAMFVKAKTSHMVHGAKGRMRTDPGIDISI